MSDTYMDLGERLEEAYADIENDIVIDLRENSEECRALFEQLTELKKKNPIIVSCWNQTENFTYQQRNALFCGKHTGSSTSWKIWNGNKFTSVVIRMRWHISRKLKRYNHQRRREICAVFMSNH